MRLLVHVEGETEKAFIDGVVAPYLGGRGYSSVSARLIGDRRARANRGGGVSWSSVRKGIVRHLKEDRQAFVTTMVDYYGMPQSTSTQWPGRVAASSLPAPQRAEAVQNAIAEDIATSMGGTFDPRRFISYVSMHEFEALLFSDCERFASAVGRPEIAVAMQDVLDQFGDPEAIDDSKETAPSKRIGQLMRPLRYDKVAFAPIATQAIGLDAIRCQCANFARWLERLEGVASAGA